MRNGIGEQERVERKVCGAEQRRDEAVVERKMDGEESEYKERDVEGGMRCCN